MPNALANYYRNLITTNPNLRKFLDLIGWAEGAGYNTGFGNRPINNLSWHPYLPRQFSHNGDTTSAAGKYQFQRGTWETTAKALGLNDFSPESQDIAAVYLIDQKRKQLGNVLSGNVDKAVVGLRSEWESFAVRPLSSILSKFGVTTIAPSVTASPSFATATKVNFDTNVQVIGAKNRYLIAFTILVIIFVFAFKR